MNTNRRQQAEYGTGKGTAGAADYERSADFQSALRGLSGGGAAAVSEQLKPTGSRRSAGFSLIELLVVIGVIVALAGMTFPVVNAVKRAQAIHRARAELTHIELAIEAYKEKLGFYPPDNPPNSLPSPDWTKNQLYYELMGTVQNGAQYETLDGSAKIAMTPAAFQLAFGGSTKVVGFLNSTKSVGSDESGGAVQFLKNLRPAQFMPVTLPVTSTVLGVSMSGATVFTGPTGEITPYGYCSSSPRYNARSFDLWVDIIAGGKITRICNWSDKPLNPPNTNYP